jgi:hypothetical protein
MILEFPGPYAFTEDDVHRRLASWSVNFDELPSGPLLFKLHVVAGWTVPHGVGDETNGDRIRLYYGGSPIEADPPDNALPEDLGEHIGYDMPVTDWEEAGVRTTDHDFERENPGGTQPLRLTALCERNIWAGPPHDLTVYSVSVEITAPPAAVGLPTGGLPPTDPAAADAELGVDLDVMTDLPPSFTLARGFKNLANAIVRRLSTPKGALAKFGDDPDYGLGLMGWLNASRTTAEVQALGGEIEEQVTADERIQSAEVTVEFSHETSTLSVDLALTTAAGPFRLVLAASQRTVEVINAREG